MKTVCSLIVLSLFYARGFSQSASNKLTAFTSSDVTMLGPLETEGEASSIHLPEPTSTTQVTQASLTTPVIIFPTGDEHVVSGLHVDVYFSPMIKIRIHKVNVIY